MTETLLTVRTGPSVIRLNRYRPGDALPLHAHEHATISVLLSGGLVETAGAASESASALSVVFKPARFCHANRVSLQGATVLQVELGPDDHEIEHAAAPVLGAWRWDHATPVAGLLLALADALQGPSTSRTELRRQLVRVMRDLARQNHAIEAPRSIPRPWLAEAMGRLATDEGRITIREVAARAAVHPVHLAREFRRCFGESPAGFRRRQRLRRAASLLTGTHEPLADVAYCTGFADQAHMTHELVRQIGITPRRLRRLSGLA